MSADVTAQAWQTVATAWTIVWTLILGLGSGPGLVARVGALRKLGPDNLKRLQRTGAVCAVLLCMGSTPLVVDTYRLESRHPEALSRALCSQPSSGLLPGRLQCADGKSYWAFTGQLAGPTDTLAVTYLPASSLVVLATPAPK